MRAPRLHGFWLDAVADSPVQPSVHDLPPGWVLLHFWAAGCVNCLNLHSRLAEVSWRYDVTVVGVHTPKFEAERDPQTARDAVRDRAITHAVLHDPQGVTADRYAVKGWPSLVAIDPTGRIIASGLGERSLDDVIGVLPFSGNSGPATTGRGNSSDDGVGLGSGQLREVLPQRRFSFGPSETWWLHCDPATHRVSLLDRRGAAWTSLQHPELRFPRAAISTPTSSGWPGLVVASTDSHTLWGYWPEHQEWERLPARVRTPLSLAVRDSTLWVANAGQHQVCGYLPGDPEPTYVIGSGAEALVDGPADQAVLAQPSALSLSPEGDLYWVDAESSALRSFDGVTVRTLAGLGLFDFGHRDGPAPQALLQHPQDVCFSAAALWIADTYNDAIRRFDADGVVTVVLDPPSPRRPSSVVVRGADVFIVDVENRLSRHHVVTTTQQTGFTTPGLMAELPLAPVSRLALPPGEVLMQLTATPSDLLRRWHQDERGGLLLEFNPSASSGVLFVHSQAPCTDACLRPRERALPIRLSPQGRSTWELPP